MIIETSGCMIPGSNRRSVLVSLRVFLGLHENDPRNHTKSHEQSRFVWLRGSFSMASRSPRIRKLRHDPRETFLKDDCGFVIECALPHTADGWARRRTGRQQIRGNRYSRQEAVSQSWINFQMLVTSA